MPTSGFVTVTLTPEARDALRSLAYALTGRLQTRIPLSAALLAAVAVAQAHPAELDEAISANGVSE